MISEGGDSTSVTKKRRVPKVWQYLGALLLIAFVVGGAYFCSLHLTGRQAQEIIFTSVSPSQIEVYLSGSVANEGIYTCNEDTSLGDILNRAGGVTEEGDSSHLSIYVPYREESSHEEHQKINLNTAEVWLLEALEDIGPKRAEAIVDYREEHGRFQQIEQVMNVPGIGEVTLEKNRGKITV